MQSWEVPLRWLNFCSSSHCDRVTARNATGAEEEKVISEGPWQHVHSVPQAATHAALRFHSSFTASNAVWRLTVNQRRTLDHWKWCSASVFRSWSSWAQNNKLWVWSLFTVCHKVLWFWKFLSEVVIAGWLLADLQATHQSSVSVLSTFKTRDVQMIWALGPPGSCKNTLVVWMPRRQHFNYISALSVPFSWPASLVILKA